MASLFSLNRVSDFILYFTLYVLYVNECRHLAESRDAYISRRLDLFQRDYIFFRRDISISWTRVDI